MLDLLGLIDQTGTQLAHGTYYTNSDPSAWHKCDDPWGCYLQKDGNPATTMSNPQGHTHWTPVSWETWPNYNVSAGPYAHGETSMLSTDAHATTTRLDGGGEYWDANILERPDNTASGTLWNPASDESCCGIHYAAKGTAALCACPSCTGGSIAVTKAIAVVPPVETAPQAKSVKPSPAHFMLCGHAMALGALAATVNVGDKFLKGNTSDLAENWAAEFKAQSEANAGAVTPLGQYVLKTHVLA